MHSFSALESHVIDILQLKDSVVGLNTKGLGAPSNSSGSAPISVRKTPLAERPSQSTTQPISLSSPLPASPSRAAPTPQVLELTSSPSLQHLNQTNDNERTPQRSSQSGQNNTNQRTTRRKRTIAELQLLEHKHYGRIKQQQNIIRQQQLDLDKERLDLEKQKFEFEK